MKCQITSSGPNFHFVDTRHLLRILLLIYVNLSYTAFSSTQTCWGDISNLIELYKSNFNEGMLISLSATMLQRINCFKKMDNASKVEYIDSIDTSVASINSEYCEPLVEMDIKLVEKIMMLHGRTAAVQNIVIHWQALMQFVEPKLLLSAAGKHARELVLQSLFLLLDFEAPASEGTLPESEIFVSKLKVCII